MEIEKLIADLSKEAYGSDVEELLLEAATALSTLQAENEEMQKQLNMFSEFLCYMTGGLLSKTNYTAQEMATAAEDYQQKVCGECDLRAENEKLRAELEKVKRENNALWTYIEIVDREYRRYMDRGYIDRLDELKKVWKRGQKED